MQFGLSEEQQMIVSTVRRFVETEIYPHEAEVERSGEVPEGLGEEIKRKVIEMGFYACNFPEEVGGAGLSHLDFTLVERELGIDRVYIIFLLLSRLYLQSFPLFSFYFLHVLLTIGLVPKACA